MNTCIHAYCLYKPNMFPPSDPFMGTRTVCPGGIRHNEYYAVLHTTANGPNLCCDDSTSRMTKTDGGKALQINTCLTGSSYGEKNNNFLDQVRLRTEVLCTPSSTRSEFELIWPLDHDSTFHVTKTPALTTWPSVASTVTFGATDYWLYRG